MKYLGGDYSKSDLERAIKADAKRQDALRKQALAAKPAKLVRLTDEEILDCWMRVKGFPSEHTTRSFAHNIMDAMEQAIQKMIEGDSGS